MKRTVDFAHNASDENLSAKSDLHAREEKRSARMSHENVVGDDLVDL